MSIDFITLVLALGAAGPSTEPPDGATPLFTRAEPSIDAGAAALSDGDGARALELFRKARADSPNQRAIVEYDVGQALAAQALASAAPAAPPATAQPAQPAQPGHEPAQTPQLDKTMVDDAQAAFSRARGLARDPRVKAEASLAGGNLAAFAGDVDSAIAQYRQALMDDPTNERAKKNLRRALEAKKQQPPPPQNNQGDQQDDQNKDDQNQDDQNQDDQKQDQQKQDDQNQDDQKQDQQKQDQQKQNQQPGSPEANKAQKKEVARRLLDALRARERPLTPLEMRAAKPVRAKEGKDW